jgi:hypothetical protein
LISRPGTGTCCESVRVALRSGASLDGRRGPLDGVELVHLGAVAEQARRVLDDGRLERATGERSGCTGGGRRIMYQLYT